MKARSSFSLRDFQRHPPRPVSAIVAAVLILALLPSRAFAVDLDPNLRAAWPGFIRDEFRDIHVAGSYAYVYLNDTLAVFDIDIPDDPDLISVHQVPQSSGIAVTGRYGYSDEGRITDLGGAANPAWLSSRFAISWDERISLSADYMYVASGSAGLKVFDVSNPGQLLQVGSYRQTNVVGFRISGVWVPDNYTVALVTDQTGGLLAVDIRNPGNIQAVGSYITTRPVQDVAFSGNIAVAAEGTFGLGVFDLNNFGRIGAYDSTHTSASLRGVAVSANTVLAVYGLDGLEVIDISNLSSPQRIGGCPTGGDALKVAVSGHYAHVAAGHEGLKVVDFSNAADPRLVGGYHTGGNAYTRGKTFGVAVSGPYGYLADENFSLQVIDLSRPNPKRVGGYDGPVNGSAECVAMHNHYAFVGTIAEMEIIDVTNPADPRRVGTYRTNAPIRAIAISGQNAYLAADRTGLLILDILNPVNPQSVSAYDTPDSALGVAVSYPYAYVADRNAGLHVISILDLSNPQRIGGYQTRRSAYGVAVSDKHTYVADDDGLQVLDVSNPANPQRVAEYVVGDSAEAVAVAGHYAVVAAGRAIEIIDIADPTSPRRVALYPARDWATGVAISGDYAYIADSQAGMQIIGLLQVVPSMNQPNFGLHLPGLTGVRLRVQRSTNLIDWEDWQSLTLGNTPSQISDTTTGPRRFYRAVSP